MTLQDVNPPEAVKSAFNAVNEAKQEKERLINEAWRDYNQSVPKSKGVGSAQRISEAQGYALKRVNEAQGDADRFKAIRSEYQKAKDGYPPPTLSRSDARGVTAGERDLYH